MSDTPPGQVTQLLVAWTRGQEGALEKLTPLVYDELHRLARRYMQRERPDHSLQATDLVHEAYVRLVDCNRVQWRDHAHFLAVGSQLMRRILVDFARKRQAQKRGGEQVRVTLAEQSPASDTPMDILALHDALEELAELDPRKAKVVELRFFGGLSLKEIGEVLAVSTDTLERDWVAAKAWLRGELKAAE